MALPSSRASSPVTKASMPRWDRASKRTTPGGIRSPGLAEGDLGLLPGPAQFVVAGGGGGAGARLELGGEGVGRGQRRRLEAQHDRSSSTTA